MKKFLKVFFLILILLIVGTLSGFAIFKAVYTPTHLRNQDNHLDEIVNLKDDQEITFPDNEGNILDLEKTEDELWVEAIRASDRVNVLLFGTDGERADTLIFLSYSKKSHDITMVTVPRDTKHEVEGMNALGQDKINAVYCFGNNMGGSDNQVKAIESILGVPIHYYIRVSYNGLKAVVDAIGGIEINVHRDMNYDDSWADPELHIHLNQGLQVLNGDKAMQYIRWRKNNDGSGDSDLARQQRQQEFILKVIKKSFGLDIVKVIGVTYDYVKTNMSKEDVLYYGSELIGFDFSTVNRHVLPGEADMKYYYQDVEATKLLMQQIYGFK
ncbi:MAG: LCP family protein [Clostridia bacterium]|nr:LCP family protein [Clostridia bacterium]